MSPAATRPSGERGGWNPGGAPRVLVVSLDGTKNVHLPSPHRPVLALLGPALLVVACSSDNTPTGQYGTMPTGSVSVVNNAFIPAATTIQVGQTVTWTWNGGGLHDVTFDNPAIGNSATQTSGSFQKSFPTAGEFTYFCTVHSRAIMSGRVTVGGG